MHERVDQRRAPRSQLVALLTNPLHHTNSTAIADWAMRRPAAHLHLMARCTTAYWAVVASVAAGVTLNTLHYLPPAEIAQIVAERKVRDPAGPMLPPDLLAPNNMALDPILPISQYHTRRALPSTWWHRSSPATWTF